MSLRGMFITRGCGSGHRHLLDPQGGRLSNNADCMGRRTWMALILFAWVAVLPLGCSGSATTLIAFTNVHVVPMTSERIIDNQTVLVDGATIVAMGDSDTLLIPDGAQVIQGQGDYLVPGLADMHMHTNHNWEDRNVWPVHPLNLYLANGVTTIRDFSPQGSPITYALQWRDEISAGVRNGPTIYASGQLLYASPLGDPEGMVRRNHDWGFDFIKLYSYLTIEDFHDAMVAAKEIGIYTAGHIPYAVGLEGVLAEGMDEIAHVEELLFEFLDVDRNVSLSSAQWLPYIIEAALQQWDFSLPTFQANFEIDNQAALESITQRLRSAAVPVCTTMVVDDVIQWKLFHPEAFLERAENQYLPSEYIDRFQRGEEKHQVQLRGVEGLAVFKYNVDRWVLKGLHIAGILLVSGTDSGTGGMGIVPGYSLHDELSLLVEDGFSPYEAIATSTLNAAIVAERMAGDGDFGTIEVGKRADLILVRDNPLEDLATLREPLGVMAAGRWYPQEMLNEMITLVEEAPYERP